MLTRPPLLTFVAKALVKHLGNLAGSYVYVPVAGDIVVEIWEQWSQAVKEDQRRAEVEAIARAAAGEIVASVRQVLREVAPELPEPQREMIENYLIQVPAAVRRSLRRPADPTGTTIPRGLRLGKATDLLPLLPSHPPRFKAGDRPQGVGDLELVELLGVGGFGEVWKARNPQLDSLPPLALKFCTDPDARERLLRHEAGIINRVMRQGRHEGIVRLEHSFLGADPPCLAYEYIEGGDLAGLILEWHRTGVPTPEQAARVVRQLAEIMAFAHAQNPPIVHRDLKPANILVQQRENGKYVFKIADFGIGGMAAQYAIDETKKGTGRMDLLATELRGACTALYASPQQMSGAPPDPRDDVYALGVIWLQLLLGDLTKGRPGGVAWQKRLTNLGISEQILALLVRCLEEEPADRPKDASILFSQLEALIAPARPSNQTNQNPPAHQPSAPTKKVTEQHPPEREDLEMKGERVLARMRFGLLAGLVIGGIVGAIGGCLGGIWGMIIGGIFMSFSVLGLMARTFPSDDSSPRFIVVGLVGCIIGGWSGRCDGPVSGAIIATFPAGVLTSVVYGLQSLLRRRIQGKHGPLLPDKFRSSSKMEWLICLGGLVITFCGSFFWVRFLEDNRLVWPRDNSNQQATAQPDEQQRQKAIDDSIIRETSEKIQQNPKDPAAYIERARAELRQGKTAQAIEDLNNAIRLDPKRSQAYTVRGRCFGKQGDLEQAERDFEEAIKLDPQSAEAYRCRGELFAIKEDHERARQDCTLAIRLEPTHAAAYALRAWLPNSNPDQVLKDCNQAIQLDPKLATAYLRRGMLQAQKGKIMLAFQDVNMTLQLDPRHAAAYLVLGKLYASEGKYDLAVISFDRALELENLSRAWREEALSLREKSLQAMQP